MINRLLISGGLAAAALAVAHAQQPTFGTTTRTIAIYATVTDPQGRLASDLTRDSFEVYDNGVKQDLTVFSNDIQPITGILLLDRSGSMKPNLDLEVRAAETFVHGMLLEDRLRIGNFGQDIVIEPDDFTSDKDALFKVLRGDLQTHGADAALERDRPRDRQVAAGENPPRRRRDERRRRRARRLHWPCQVDEGRDEAREDDDIMIYAVGVEGLAPFQQQGGSPGFGGGIMPPRARNQDAMQKPDEDMAKIAAATGGGYFELTSPGDVLGKFDRVIDELHHQYALGFVPQKTDGKLHELTVKVNKPGYAVRARKHYLAPRR